MKISQVIMLMLIINLCNVMVGFVIQGADIGEVGGVIETWFDDDDNGLNSAMTELKVAFINTDNWLLKKIVDIAQGFTNAVNMFGLIFKIIGLVIWAWIEPNKYVITSESGFTVFKFLGFVGVMILNWINVWGFSHLIGWGRGSES